MDAWRPVDKSSSQAWARIIDFSELLVDLGFRRSVHMRVPLGFGVHGISIEPRFPFGCFNTN